MQLNLLSCSVTLPVFTVSGSSGSLYSTSNTTFNNTSDVDNDVKVSRVCTGVVLLTSSTVRNDPWYSINALPNSSCAVSSRNTCTKESDCHGTSGRNSTTWPLLLTVVLPLTNAPFSDTYNASGTVNGLRGSSRYQTILVFKATLLAPLPGR